MSEHVSELQLRRLLASEAIAVIASEHVGTCTECQEKLKALNDEQKRFEAAIPFEKFAAGVETKASALSKPKPRIPVFALAAAAAIVIGIIAVNMGGPIEPTTHLKGANEVEVVVAPEMGPQRVATGALEALQPGDRVRVGIHVTTQQFVMVFSIDDQGELSTVYAERGASVSVSPSGGTQFLPDSLQFEGAGEERLVILLSEKPLAEEQAAAAVKNEFERAGKALSAMQSLKLPAETVYRSFRKP